MQSGWVRWIAYTLLAALVVVTSCQAMAGAPEPLPVHPSVHKARL